MEPFGSSVCAFGAGVLLRHLQAMLIEAPGVSSAQDIDHIHRMRVASRRLRAALPLFASCFSERKVSNWMKAACRVTRSLGAARDLDVQLEALFKFSQESKLSQCVPGLRRLQVRWGQRRQDQQSKILKALDELQKSAVFEKMGAVLLPLTLGVEPGAPPQHDLYDLAHRSIQTNLDEFLSYEIFIRQPERIAELHQMRIAAKRLRYTLETFAPLFPDGLAGYLSIMRNAQELLGEIHDCDVWMDALPSFLEEEKVRTVAFYGSPGPWNLLLPGVKAFMENRRNTRFEKYQAFLRKWQSWNEKQTWETLRRLITMPVINRAALYPLSAGQIREEETGVPNG